MYGRLGSKEDASNWEEDERNTFRNDQLETHADVVFKLYDPIYPQQQEFLYNLLFRPSSDPIKWMRLIIKKYPTLKVSWTHDPVRNVISIWGDSKTLREFCEKFPDYLQEIETEELTARLQETLTTEENTMKEELPKK